MDQVMRHMSLGVGGVCNVRMGAVAFPWGCVCSVTALCSRPDQSRAGSPFTLYRDLACLSKWLIKMSYYQSHAESFSFLNFSQTDSYFHLSTHTVLCLFHSYSLFYCFDRIAWNLFRVHNKPTKWIYQYNDTLICKVTLILSLPEYWSSFYFLRSRRWPIMKQSLCQTSILNMSWHALILSAVLFCIIIYTVLAEWTLNGSLLQKNSH